MMRAITPPMQKNRNDAIRYMYPMVLWSVEVIHLTRMFPLCSTFDWLTTFACPAGRSVTVVNGLLSLFPLVD